MGAGQGVGEAGREGAPGKGCGPTRHVSVSLTFTQSLSQTHSDTVSPTLVPIILLFSYHHHMHVHIAAHLT